MQLPPHAEVSPAALVLARRAPQPERSWGERPLGMLLDILRFFAEVPGLRWRKVRWKDAAMLRS